MYKNKEGSFAPFPLIREKFLILAIVEDWGNRRGAWLAHILIMVMIKKDTLLEKWI